MARMSPLPNRFIVARSSPISDRNYFEDRIIGEFADLGSHTADLGVHLTPQHVDVPAQLADVAIDPLEPGVHPPGEVVQPLVCPRDSLHAKDVTPQHSAYASS